MYRITGYAYCIWLSFGDAHPLVHLVLHMARDLFAGHVLVFVFCEHIGLASMRSHVYCLDQPILLPHYWFSFPTCCPSLPSSFAPYLFSLSCASSSSWVLWLCPDPALPFPAQFSPPQGSFCCLFWFYK